ncbi:amino acid/polyamine transporter I [Ilyonectria destructans]|nr:amino acid/polyamine transporter I [Ilyonectria destructans]
MSAGTTSNSNEGHLQPRLSGLTMVAMAFAILNTWIALAGSIGLILPSGGSVSLLYGFLFCVLCNFALTASLGEMAAIWPTSGGQYHFVYALCTDKWNRLMSFWVGWTNIAGWLVVVTVQAFFAAQFVCAAAVMASNETYTITAWSTYLIFLAIIVFSTVGNIWGNRILGRWNDMALLWSILGVVIIGIVLLAMSEKTDAKYVFTDFNNETGWSDGMAWILGLLQSALSLIGFDVVLHMAEEMPNPARDAPRAMIYAIAVGGVTGTAFILIILFCLVDPTTIVSSPTGMPIVELIHQATGSRAAATILTLMLGICFINGTNASMTSASRLLYAMSRDKGIVFHQYFSHIHPSLNVPVRTILVCFFFNVAFGLLYLGPTVAFSAYVASCTILLNVSYAFPIITLLIRGRKILEQHQTNETPFKLGKWGYAINWTAALFVVVTSIFFCFPASLPVSGNTMNYVSAVIGIFFVVIGIYWFVYGHRFEGPKFDVILGEQADNATARSHSLTVSLNEKEVARRDDNV